MTISLNNDIVVNITTTPLKNKASKSLYDIYLLFSITQQGIQAVRPATFSTGMSITVNEWDIPRKEVKGRSLKASSMNTKLNKHINDASQQLETLRFRDKLTCSDVKEFIKLKVRTVVTGKAPRGQKAAFQAKLKAHSLDAVLHCHFMKEQQSQERQDGYRYSLAIFSEFFNHETPLITNINKKDLERFLVWYYDSYNHSVETRITYLSMIRAIFNCAVEEGIIPVKPIPKKFVPIKEDETIRHIITETDRLKFINLNEEQLTNTQKVAKYCAVLQITTGIGYVDLRTLVREHLKYDNDRKQWYINRPRAKSKIWFKVYLTARAKYSLDMLRKFAVGTDTVFKLPSLDYMNRMYKELAKMVGINKFTTYDLRHTFAVDYMDNDGRLEDLAKILGHKKLDTTRLYGKISDKRQYEKMQQLEQKSKMHQLA